MPTEVHSPPGAIRRWLKRASRAEDRAVSWSLALFIAAGVLVVTFSVGSLVSSNARRESRRSMQATYELRTSLERFIALMARAEGSVRAVALNGDAFYLQRYRERRPQVLELLDAVERLAQDPGERRQIRALRPLVVRQFDDNDAVLNAWLSGGTAAAAQAMAGQPPDVTHEIARLTDALQAGIQQRLARETARSAADERAARVALVTGVLLSGLFATIAIVMLFRAHATVRRSNRALAVARDEAVRASRHKSEFLATVSHEIRTPMNAIVSLAGLLSDAQLDTEQREMKQVMVRAGENLLTIIDELLDLSKIEAGKLRLEAKPLDPIRVARDTVSLLAARAGEKNLALRLERAGEPGKLLLGDAARLRQVLTNLVANAIKYTDAGGIRVVVATTPDPRGPATAGAVADHGTTTPGAPAPSRERVRYEVHDTGPGIPAEMQPRLFRPFAQGEAGMRRSGSTGLGLAISRQLVELMGGRIGVTSSPGEGSTFWFEVPLEPAPAESAAAPLPVAAAHPAAPLRLLVVEDDPDNQVVARIVLRSLGHTVDLASSGDAALERLQAQPYDAVLMDCHMPGLDGYEATRRIRAGGLAGINPHVPIIGLTAYALPGDRDKCLGAGMNEYLTKPIRLERMSAALARCVHAAAQAPAPTGTGGTDRVAGADEPELDPTIADIARRLPGTDGPALWPEMLAVFHRDEPGRRAALGHAIARRDGADAALCAHTLAGSCAAVGALRMRTLALRLEAAARAGHWADVGARWTELEHASRRVHALLAGEEVEAS